MVTPPLDEGFWGLLAVNLIKGVSASVLPYLFVLLSATIEERSCRRVSPDIALW